METDEITQAIIQLHKRAKSVHARCGDREVIEKLEEVLDLLHDATRLATGDTGDE